MDRPLIVTIRLGKPTLLDGLSRHGSKETDFLPESKQTGYSNGLAGWFGRIGRVSRVTSRELSPAA